MKDIRRLHIELNDGTSIEIDYEDTDAFLEDAKKLLKKHDIKDMRVLCIDAHKEVWDRWSFSTIKSMLHGRDLYNKAIAKIKEHRKNEE